MNANFFTVDLVIASTTPFLPRAAMAKYVRPMKITVVGNGTVGKTSILVTYSTKQFPCDYVPTVFENYSTDIRVEGISYSVTIWDTAGQEEYSRLRPISYPNTDVFILCYAICDRQSLKAVTDKWMPELRHHCPDTPVVLVGTKSDTRGRPCYHNFVTKEEGEVMAKTIQATAFLECSALNNENLELVFRESVKASVENSKSAKKCTVL